MAGDYDKRPLFDVRCDAGGGRVAKGAGVGGVQQLHAAEIHLAELHDKGQPFLHGVLSVHGAQALIEPRGDCFVLMA